MYDAVIVGGGIVGTMTALLLAKETSLRIALIEQKPFSLHWHPDQYGERTSAISLATKSIFEKVECFAAMEKKRIFPYRKMHVWDIEDKGELHFSATDTKEKCLGYMIEDEVMRIALFEKLQQSSVDILSPYHLQAIHKKDLYVELVSGDHNVIHTKLLIGADGANSWVRETLQISYKNLDYDQTAVILNVKTELPHEQTARQRFLSTGPLAFLPLDDPHICSIVW
ncbi:MAG TPA: FAD-dependent monooxygenase, partial [Gammaproteobacteria bacterium]|nr:FAD-dependent monooxygenase [Gammaproteobacteria bacterium]